MTIHFICRGNVLRSLIAETYLRSLQLPRIESLSSGTVTDPDSVEEQQFFAATQKLLEKHGIAQFAKRQPDKLTQDRLEDNDVVVCMNERVFDEAKTLVALPADTKVWSIVDIGEGNRIVKTGGRDDLEEIIYNEIEVNVDKLVSELTA